MSDGRLRIAVVGGGAAGITAAHLLSRRHDVVLFEKNDYVGGHTNTIVIDRGPDEGTPVDTGFIVLNDKNYPTLHRLLRDLEVPVRWSNMSFGYYCEKTGFQYAGRSLGSLFADRQNLFRLRFWRVLGGIYRFCRLGSRRLCDGTLADLTLGEFLRQEGFGKAVVDDYIVPMGAAIWSAPGTSILEFPAQPFMRFFANHGLLSIEDRPRWQTVVGGSRSYVQSFLRRFPGQVRLRAAVTRIRRSSDGAEVRCASGEPEFYNRVVIAAHADEALAMLEQPTETELELLGAWRYSKNQAVLHTSISALPPLRAAWASWNYLRHAGSSNESPVSVSYWMNLLQGLQTKKDYVVTLNYPRKLPEAEIVKTIEYTHPVYSSEALRLQPRLDELNASGNLLFCGSYFGFGFHEDAVRSGAAAAARFDLEL